MRLIEAKNQEGNVSQTEKVFKLYWTRRHPAGNISTDDWEATHWKNIPVTRGKSAHLPTSALHWLSIPSDDELHVTQVAPLKRWKNYHQQTRKKEECGELDSDSHIGDTSDMAPHVERVRYLVEKILDTRKVKGEREYLILWQDYSIEEASWEKARHCECPDAIAAFYKERRAARFNKPYSRSAITTYTLRKKEEPPREKLPFIYTKSKVAGRLKLYWESKSKDQRSSTWSGTEVVSLRTKELNSSHPKFFGCMLSRTSSIAWSSWHWQIARA
ncbi:hypothetical protein RB195_002154 [Necator americanus]|uniref:Chromo domain-containing protein n=1 Tax=Necator americanus TaxID=51031 RepID=A0ABR1DI66_NECAM